jgi:HEPN domain-containing protein
VAADARDWLDFAAADLAAAQLLVGDPTVPARIACFHAQPSAEKAFKAVLVSTGTMFRRTHDLLVLVAQLPPRLAIEVTRLNVVLLQPWAVDGRYPGDLPNATPQEAIEAVDTAEAIANLCQCVLADALVKAPSTIMTVLI